MLVAGPGFTGWILHRQLCAGLWLAFVTAATVGTATSCRPRRLARVLAVIIVVIGLALLTSVVTASVAAFFIGEDEKLLRREMPPTGACGMKWPG